MGFGAFAVIGRRSRTDHYTPAEAAIRHALEEVEKLSADVRLTDAVCLLAEAQNAVADYVDGEKKLRRSVAYRPWET